MAKQLRANMCALLLLSGCDGPSSPASAPSPTPIPTPTPTPTPTPSPTPAAASFPLEGRETFPLNFYASGYTGNAAGTIGVLAYPPESVAVTSTGNRTLEIGSDPNFGWTLTAPSEMRNFIYYFRHALAGAREIESSDASGRTGLALLNNILPGEQPDESAFRLSYVSYAFTSENAGGLIGQPRRYVTHVLGYPTVAASVPAAGAKDFATVVRAYIYTVRNRANITGTENEQTAYAFRTLTVNFATGAISFNIVADLTRDPALPAVTTT